MGISRSLQRAAEMVGIAAAFILISGCVGSGSPQDLARETGLHTSFIVAGIPSDVAYGRVVQASRACFPQPIIVEADWFPDRRAGRVSMAMKTVLSVSTGYVVDVAPAAAGTAVHVVYHPSANAVPATIRVWIEEGTYSTCKL